METRLIQFRSRNHWRRLFLLLLLVVVPLAGGCATLRVTDPYRTATEQFLMTTAAQQAVTQLSLDGLRDRLVYMDTAFYMNQQSASQDLFLVGELRARLLREGVRLTPNRQNADVVVEIRSGGLGIDRQEYLLGIPSAVLSGGGGGGAAGTSAGGVPVSTPELAIVKSTKQRGFASVAIVAYRATTGELIAQSGPFVGRTRRDDYWFFGTGPRTTGDIPPAEPAVGGK